MFDAGVWFDTGYVFDETNTTALDASPKYINVPNGGNCTVINANITISVPAGGTPITNLVITVPGISSFAYSGTIAANTSLIIDCGAQSVMNNGIGDLAHFTLHPTAHLIDDWLRLEPGNNTMAVTLTGGGANSTIGWGYFDGWQ